MAVIIFVTGKSFWHATSEACGVVRLLVAQADSASVMSAAVSSLSINFIV
jgi:hypothetical protein